MKKITGNFFLLIFLMQMLISCCGEETYEITITGMESRALISDGLNFIAFDTQKPIDKEALIIEVLITEVEEITSTEPFKKKITAAPVLEAAVVPCEDQVVVFKNRIERIKVEVLDSNTNNERIDITNQVVIQGTRQSIAEYLSDNNPGLRGFLIELSDTRNIPDRIEYFIEATLDDGLRISSTGGIINFN
jgi:hypothetical protein